MVTVGNIQPDVFWGMTFTEDHWLYKDYDREGGAFDLDWVKEMAGKYGNNA